MGVLAGCGMLLVCAHLLPALSVLGKNPPGPFPGSSAVQREGAGLQLSPLLKPGRSQRWTKKRGRSGVGMGCCAQQVPCAMFGGGLVSRAASCLLSDLPTMSGTGENTGEEAPVLLRKREQLRLCWSRGSGGVEQERETVLHPGSAGNECQEEEICRGAIL